MFSKNVTEQSLGDLGPGDGDLSDISTGHCPLGSV